MCKFPVDLDDAGSMKKRMSRVKADYDVLASDMLTMDENLIDFEQKLEAMYEPDERDEPTVAMVLEGGMYFDVEYEDDKWVRIHMERGDLIAIPKHKLFRSTTTSKNFVKLQRFAKRPSTAL
ncbi:ARD/ARD' family domain-containing protein [Ditylenchus destructor]|uniref:ARD/ARD' family domain-containing protein n=1 Tax=Ditylenchus destructor TaxID=166010 RepID=A0AAD4NFY9_9BILA|nr:ARD/ARD' family domain-containing protein [Ditylenchus destructor]